MPMTDPIADLLTRIRNAVSVGHESVAVPKSRIKAQILEILRREGFIESFREVEDRKGPHFLVLLKYDKDNRGIIRGLERVSRPSRRIYVGRDDIPYVRDGLGLAILTTPQGLLTDRQARSAGIGGEVLCYIW
jgi:small subunit ribosomal protein S8